MGGPEPAEDPEDDTPEDPTLPPAGPGGPVPTPLAAGAAGAVTSSMGGLRCYDCSISGALDYSRDHRCTHLPSPADRYDLVAPPAD